MRTDSQVQLRLGQSRGLTVEDGLRRIRRHTNLLGIGTGELYVRVTRRGEVRARLGFARQQTGPTLHARLEQGADGLVLRGELRPSRNLRRAGRLYALLALLLAVLGAAAAAPRDAPGLAALLGVTAVLLAGVAGLCGRAARRYSEDDLRRDGRALTGAVGTFLQRAAAAPHEDRR